MYASMMLERERKDRLAAQLSKTVYGPLAILLLEV